MSCGLVKLELKCNVQCFIWRETGNARKPENTNCMVRRWQHHVLVLCCRRDSCTSIGPMSRNHYLQILKYLKTSARIWSLATNRSYKLIMKLKVWKEHHKEVEKLWVELKTCDKSTCKPDSNNLQYHHIFMKCMQTSKCMLINYYYSVTFAVLTRIKKEKFSLI